MTHFEIKNVEYILNGIVKIEAENSKCSTGIMLPHYELDIDLKPGVQFSMNHHSQNQSCENDVTFFGITCLSTPDYVLISNGGLLIEIKAFRDTQLNISEYGQNLYTYLSFKNQKKRGRPKKSA